MTQSGEAIAPYRLIASWTDWSAERCLKWDDDRSCYRFVLLCSDDRPKTFKFCLDSDTEFCLHPDRPEASMHTESELQGPDYNGGGKFWCIGAHPFDKVQLGVRYEVRLFVEKASGIPERVDWETLPPWPAGAGSDLPIAPTFSMKLVGSWNQWSQAVDTEWDSERWCFRHFLALGPSGSPESFQFLQNGSWGLCMHPDRGHASCHSDHELCGPDGRGHEKNWCIGLHPMDGAEPKAIFEVRLHVSPRGRPCLVDWARCAKTAAPRVCSQQVVLDLGGSATAASDGDVSQLKKHAEEQRRCGNMEGLARCLQMIAESELDKNQPRSALATAEECVRVYTALSSRWRRGIALHTVAQAHMAVALLESGDASSSLRSAMEACEQAVQLLRNIGNAREESDLAAARATLGVIRQEIQKASCDDGERSVPVEESRSSEETRNVTLPAGLAGELDFAGAADVPNFAAVGSWDDWSAPIPLRWDVDRGLYVFTVMLAHGEAHDFQLLQHADWKKRVHPDLQHATMHTPFQVCGPDSGGDDLTWRIGPPTVAQEKPDGFAFEIRLKVEDTGVPIGLSWVELDRAGCEVLAWQAEVARLRQHPNSEDASALPDALRHTALLLLETGGAVEKALDLATEAASLFAIMGSRWRTGIAWSIVAEAWLRVLNSTSEMEGDPSTSQVMIDALKASIDAVALLSKVGHPHEEQDLLAACKTLSALLRKLPPPEGLAAPLVEAHSQLLFSAAQHLKDKRMAEEAEFAARLAVTWCSCAGAADKAARAMHLAAKAQVSMLEACVSKGASAELLSATAAAEAVTALRAVEDIGSEEVTLACHTYVTGEILKQAIGRSSTDAKLQEGDLQQTFGYALGMEKQPNFARFDVRAEVCVAVGGFEHGQVVRESSMCCDYLVIGVMSSPTCGSSPSLWFQPLGLNRPASCHFAGSGSGSIPLVLAPTGERREVPAVHPEDFDLAEDSDGEFCALCHDCLLPLGTSAYTVDSEGTEGQVHGECKAALILTEAEVAWQSKMEAVAAQKRKESEEYGIGWQAEKMVPRAEEFLDGLGLIGKTAEDDSRPMFCCILESDEETDVKSIRIARTSDPEAAVILPYLALALQARRQDGIAPYFSLDTPRADRSWQVKTFQPTWLHGTCAGEVLFQADYHLKALSMGGVPQPVAGMGSVWDFPWHQPSWRGREWFVIKDAKVYLSDNNVLMPFVQMGVEAREQAVDDGNRVVDATVTATDHPLVKYAASFTQYFDLISERKSVVYYLRELSKASVLAKFLLENEIYLEEAWWQFPPSEGSEKRLDLPLTRHERCYHQVLVNDGVIKETHGGIAQDKVEVVGGVDLNVDAFDLVNVVRVAKSVENTEAFQSERPLALAIVPLDDAEGLAKLPTRELRRRIRLCGSHSAPGPCDRGHLIEEVLRLQGAAAGAPPKDDDSADAQAAGVLLQFERELRKLHLPEETFQMVLLAAKRAGVGESESASATPSASPFSAFLRASVDAQELMKAVFNDRLSDRHRDGALFVPPPTAAKSYMQTLERMVALERKAQEGRRAAFLAKDFDIDAPGPLFPSSWKPSFKVCFGRGAAAHAAGSRRGENMRESSQSGLACLKTKPIFEKLTEDGVKYQIFRADGLEVRSVTPPGNDDRADAVYEIQALTAPHADHPVVKVVQLVEGSSASRTSADAEDHRSAVLFKHFVVFETDLGDCIITELDEEGTATWKENPNDLEQRYAKARVVHAAECIAVTVGSLRTVCSDSIGSTEPLTSKKYAQQVFAAMHRAWD